MTSEAVSYQNTNEDDEQHGADDDDGYQCNVVTSVVVLQEHTVPTHTHTHTSTLLPQLLHRHISTISSCHTFTFCLNLLLQHAA